ncbi:MAG: hypothetical protein ACXACX_09260 [Candidatus Hodarchaeales archaeon]|jgi:hypothetical protein
MKLIESIGVILVLSYFACNAISPPDCPEGQELKCECVDKVEPTTTTVEPTTTTAPVEDCTRFITVIAAGKPAFGDYTVDCEGSTGRLRNLCYQRQALWVDKEAVEYLLYHCPDKLDEINSTYEELEVFVPIVNQLISRLDRFYRRLQIEDEECSGRTIVNRDYVSKFQEDRKAFEAQLKIYNDRAQAHECRQTEAYDNLKGFCCQCFKRGPKCSDF